MKKKFYNVEQISFVTVFFLIFMQCSYYLNPHIDGRNAVWYVYQVVSSLFGAGVGLTFMLSGYQNLGQFEEIRNDKIFSFYQKKAIRRGIPFLIFALAVYIRSSMLGQIEVTVNRIIDFPMKFLTGNINQSFWFIYYLIGAWVVTPFLGIMLEELSDWELELLTMISLVLQTVITAVYFTPYAFSFQIFLTFGILNWLFYYILGYTMRRLSYRRPKTGMAVLLLFGSIIVSMLLKVFIPINNVYTDNQSLTMILTCIALFSLFHDSIRLPGKKLISILSRHSITTYLVHGLWLGVIGTFVSDTLALGQVNLYVSWIVIFILTFLGSILSAVIIDNLIIGPITHIVFVQFMPGREWRKKEKKRIEKIEKEEKRAEQKKKKELLRAEKERIEKEERESKLNDPVRTAKKEKETKKRKLLEQSRSTAFGTSVKKSRFKAAEEEYPEEEYDEYEDEAYSDDDYMEPAYDEPEEEEFYDEDSLDDKPYKGFREEYEDDVEEEYEDEYEEDEFEEDDYDYDEEEYDDYDDTDYEDEYDDDDFEDDYDDED